MEGAGEFMSTLCINDNFLVLRDENELQDINGGFWKAVVVVVVVVVVVAMVFFLAGMVYEGIKQGAF